MPDTPAGPVPKKTAILRSELGIPDGDLVFLYQGGLFRARRIEQLLRVFSRAAKDRHVVFMGYGELERMVRSAAATNYNIHFRPAVSPHEVLALAGADVGLVGVENVCLSYYYSLPNKFFEESLLAGVPVLGSDSQFGA